MFTCVPKGTSPVKMVNKEVIHIAQIREGAPFFTAFLQHS